jgi:ATP-dependent RNA helicase RhlE
LLFEELKISEPIQKALKTEGYTNPTPIQVKAIPFLLKGKDLLGCAQTGTGKTAAFAIPILQGISKEPVNTKGKRQIKALILAPTRELAIQINDSFKAYGRNLGLKSLVIYGGVSQNPQTKFLGIGIDILVATPGRLLDLINQGFVKLNTVKYFVLDEADQMLDMGMLPDVKRIIKYIPDRRQTMLFSATMPDEIGKLASTLLKDPIKVEVTPVSSTVDIIKQEVYFVNKSNKTALLIELLKNKEIQSALVFSRTKHGADKIVKALVKAGNPAEAIHGNKSQNARQAALNNFKARKTRVLVATDIAARGIDIDELSHVFNFDLPEVPETYVHRIGRTGRAGLGGIAIAFCDQEEKHLLKEIQKLISKTLPVVEGHPFPLIEMPPEIKAAQPAKKLAVKNSQVRNRRPKYKK